jgi:hypothetical protein
MLHASQLGTDARARRQPAGHRHRQDGRREEQAGDTAEPRAALPEGDQRDRQQRERDAAHRHPQIARPHAPGTSDSARPAHSARAPPPHHANDRGNDEDNQDQQINAEDRVQRRARPAAIAPSRTTRIAERRVSDGEHSKRGPNLRDRDREPRAASREPRATGVPPGHDGNDGRGNDDRQSEACIASRCTPEPRTADPLGRRAPPGPITRAGAADNVRPGRRPRRRILTKRADSSPRSGSQHRTRLFRPARLPPQADCRVLPANSHIRP